MQVFAKSDIGRERKTNEDFYYVSKPEDKIRLFILADGMGGYNAGEVASKMAVEAARDYIHKHFAKNKDSKEKQCHNSIHRQVVHKVSFKKTNEHHHKDNDVVHYHLFHIYPERHKLSGIYGSYDENRHISRNRGYRRTVKPYPGYEYNIQPHVYNARNKARKKRPLCLL